MNIMPRRVDQVIGTIATRMHDISFSLPLNWVGIQFSFLPLLPSNFLSLTLSFVHNPVYFWPAAPSQPLVGTVYKTPAMG